MNNPTQTPNPRLIFPGLALAVPALVLVLAFQLAWGLVLRGLGELSLETELWFLGAGNLFSILMAAGLLVLLIRTRGKIPLPQILLVKKPNVFKARFFYPALVLTAAGASVILGEAGNWVTAALPLPESLNRLFNTFLSLHAPAATLVLLMVVAPLTEEILFRGLFLRGFRDRYGAAAALVMTSALFALFHMNPWQAPAALAAGLYLGWITLATGSLFPALGFHSLFNGLPILLSLGGLKVDGYNLPAQTPVHFMPPLLVAAGAGAVILGLVFTGLGVKMRNISR